jgi:hypothetical protein
MYILKLQLLKLKHSQIWLWKKVGKNYYQNDNIWNIKKSQQIHEVLIEMLSGLQSSPEYGMVHCDPCNTLRPSRIFKFEMISFTFL